MLAGQNNDRSNQENPVVKKTKNILVITYWSYKDALIQAYTLPYLHLFNDILAPNRYIYLVTLEQKHLQLNANERSQIRQRLRLQGIKWIDFHYYRFGVLSFLNWIPILLRLCLLAIFRGVSHIHAWCTTAGAIGYVVSVLTRKPLIMDSYEPHADVMLETKTWTARSPAYRILQRFEKLEGLHSKTQICCTSDMTEYARQSLGIQLRNPVVKPACVDLERFSFANRKKPYLLRKMGLENKIVCVYAGKFGGLYLEQEVFDFFKTASDYWGDRFRVLLLTNEREENLVHWMKASGLDPRIVHKTFVFHSSIPDYIGLGDFAISPYKPVPSRKYSAPIKNVEYWSLGLPVVITKNIADDSKIISEHQIGAVLEHLDTENYLAAVKTIDHLLTTFTIRQLYDKIRPIVERERDFNVARKVYEGIYA
jgi:hypothetical protein